MGIFNVGAVSLVVLMVSLGCAQAQTATDSLWSATAAPATSNANDTSPVNLGIKFTSDVDGTVSAIRFYKGTKNTSSHTVALWSSSGQKLATATAANETASGWQTVTLSAPIAITAGTPYTASYHTSGYYAFNQNYFNAAYSNGVLHAPVAAGVYAYGSGTAFPKSAWSNSNYWVDVVFTPVKTAPAACGSTPSGSTVTQTLSTTTGSIAATATQCPYGGTQPTTTTVTQVQLCTNGTLTNQGTSVSTTTNTGSPTCHSPVPCGSTPSGSTVTKTLSTTTGSIAATTTQCPYGGTQPTTTTVTQAQLCTNGTLSNQGASVSTTVNTGNPTCNAPAACGSTPSGSTVTQTLSTTTGSIAATATQCPYGGTQPTTTTVTQVQLCTNGALSNQGASVSATVNSGSPTCNPAPVKGACGSANGTTTNIAPTTNLCSAGNASTVAGTGPWSWSCAGTNGGATASCSAQVPVIQTQDSLWNTTVTPGTVDATDNSSVELGIKFTSNVAGTVSAIRFYKGPTNIGAHTVNLWSSSGTLLASAPSSNETASGWQTVSLSAPVSITAGTTYVASYHTPGNYAYDQNYFAAAYVNSPLSVPAGGGVYAYGTSNTFPSSSWNNSNYWVDILMTPASGNGGGGGTPVNGQCGAANGVAVSTIPSTNLCAIGTASAITGTGPWAWSCAGSNSGTTASCSATLFVTSGFPDATNTGVPAGVTLKSATSNTISAPGTYSGLSFDSTVSIEASNVTLENCKITASAGDYFSIGIRGKLSNVVIKNCEIAGAGLQNSNGGDGIYIMDDSQVTIDGLNIHDGGNGISISDGRILVKNTYIHDLNAGGAPHYNGIQYNGGGSSDFSLTISNNTILNQQDQTDALMIDSYFGPVNNVTANHNLLGGGDFTVYVDADINGLGAGGNSYPVTNVAVTNNTMKTGTYGYFDIRYVTFTECGNVDWKIGKLIDSACVTIP
jgi:hypothetical protein